MLFDAFNLSYYYAQYLWAQNPNICDNIANALRNPSVDNWDQITSAILGIGFQFHPDDVFEHAVNHLNPKLKNQEYKARHQQQLEFKNNMQQIITKKELEIIQIHKNSVQLTSHWMDTMN